MQKLTTIIAAALPLREENVDTDQIIPARFLKTTTREGFGEKLFYFWRFSDDGEKQEHILHDPRYENARILLVGKDFGIGSSREHAVWAIYDYGFRVVIGTTFGDIFYTNALKNGLLIVRLKPQEVEKLFSVAEQDHTVKFSVDLAQQQVQLPEGTSYTFAIDAFSKKCLLEGVDEIGYILSKQPYIRKYEKEHEKFLNRNEQLSNRAI